MERTFAEERLSELEKIFNRERQKAQYLLGQFEKNYDSMSTLFKQIKTSSGNALSDGDLYAHFTKTVERATMIEMNGCKMPESVAMNDGILEPVFLGGKELYKNVDYNQVVVKLEWGVWSKNPIPKRDLKNPPVEITLVNMIKLAFGRNPRNITEEEARTKYGMKHTYSLLLTRDGEAVVRGYINSGMLA